MLLALVFLLGQQGVWADGVQLACPPAAVWSDLTKLPQGCQAQEPCVCYRLQAHTTVSTRGAGLLAEVGQLKQANQDYAAHIETQKQVDVSLREEMGRLRVQVATLSDPPSRQTWFLVGAGTTAVLGLVAIGLATSW